MEDLKFLHGLFDFIKVIVYITLGIIGLVCIVAFLDGNIGVCLTCIISAIILGIGIVEIRIGRIILTRFVAMTENVLEITELLEKKFEIEK